MTLSRDGEFRAHSDWQFNWMFEQFSEQVTLALALPVAVAAPVGAVLGTTQLPTHAEAWELQVIKQVVVVELCASRILSLAAAPVPKLPSAIVNTASKTPAARMPTSSTCAQHR